MSSFINVELYYWYFPFKRIFIIIPFTKQYIMNWTERSTSWHKEFFWMSSYTYYMSQKFIVKNVLFCCMCLRNILSDVKSNIIKQFTSYIEIWNYIFFFWKKTINWDKTFFRSKENFFILTLKVWNLFEKMRLTSKIFPHNFKSFIGYLKVMEKQK